MNSTTEVKEKEPPKANQRESVCWYCNVHFHDHQDPQEIKHLPFWEKRESVFTCPACGYETLTKPLMIRFLDEESGLELSVEVWKNDTTR